MNCKFIWDNQLILDFLLDRVSINPVIYQLFALFVTSKIPILMSSSQIHNVKYVFFKERKKILDEISIKEEWESFLENVTFILASTRVRIWGRWETVVRSQQMTGNWPKHFGRFAITVLK